jgi:hypothetical protein
VLSTAFPASWADALPPKTEVRIINANKTNNFE